MLKHQKFITVYKNLSKKILTKQAQNELKFIYKITSFQKKVKSISFHADQYVQGDQKGKCKPLEYQSNMQWLSKEVAGEPDTANQKGNNMFCDYRKSKKKRTRLSLKIRK